MLAENQIINILNIIDLHYFQSSVMIYNCYELDFETKY